MSLRTLHPIALFVALSALAVTGCGSDGPTTAPPVCVAGDPSCDDSFALRGVYTGTLSIGGQGFVWRLDIPRTVSGPFNFTGSASEDFGLRRTAPITGQGNYNHPAITFSVTITFPDGAASHAFIGTVANSRDTFIMNGAFVNDPPTTYRR
ncbi:MAG: hypothetical protein ABIR58_06310 [Gemmatimonadaceae bacterium]